MINCIAGVMRMNTNKNIYITPEEYEKMQSTFNCKTEYDNGRIKQ